MNFACHSWYEAAMRGPKNPHHEQPQYQVCYVLSHFALFTYELGVQTWHKKEVDTLEVKRDEAAEKASKLAKRITQDRAIRNVIRQIQRNINRQQMRNVRPK